MASHMFVHSIAVIGNVHSLCSGGSWLSAQQWLSANCLLTASDVLDYRAWGWGLWVWTTKGHPPNGGSDCVHVCYTCSLVPYDVVQYSWWRSQESPPLQWAWYKGALQGPLPQALVSINRPSLLRSHMAELVAVWVPMPVLVRRVWWGWESLVERLGGFAGTIWGGAELIPLLALRPWMVGRSPQQPPLVGMDVGLFPIPETSGFSFLWLTLAHRVPWGHWQKGSLDSDPPPSQEGPLPRTPPHQRRRGATSPPPSIPSCFLLASMAHLQQVD